LWAEILDKKDIEEIVRLKALRSEKR